MQDINPAMWVVRDKDTTIYLFGTVHVLRPTTGWASPRVNAAFDSGNIDVVSITDNTAKARILGVVRPRPAISSRRLAL